MKAVNGKQGRIAAEWNRCCAGKLFIQQQIAGRNPLWYNKKREGEGECFSGWILYSQFFSL